MTGQLFRFSADQFQHVADLLGSADWARAAEELIQEQNEFLSDKDVRPWPEIPPQVAGHMLKDLKRGRKRAKSLSQWLEELDPWSRETLSDFLRIKAPLPPPPLPAGKGKRKTRPSRAGAPNPPPSIRDALLMVQPGRIDLAALTDPSRFVHGPLRTGLADIKAEIDKFAMQIEVVLSALQASYFPSARRQAHPSTNVSRMALVHRLAYLWRQAHGDWPGRIVDSDTGKENGPFLDLSRICLRGVGHSGWGVPGIVAGALGRIPR